PPPPPPSTPLPYTPLFRSHLQRLLVQGAPAVGQQPAEARGHHRVHLPPGQPGTAVDAEDPLVGEKVAGEGGNQGASQRDQPAPVDRKSTRLNSSHLGISYA